MNFVYFKDSKFLHFKCYNYINVRKFGTKIFQICCQKSASSCGSSRNLPVSVYKRQQLSSVLSSVIFRPSSRKILAVWTSITMWRLRWPASCSTSRLRFLLHLRSSFLLLLRHTCLCRQLLPRFPGWPLG